MRFSFGFLRIALALLVLLTAPAARAQVVTTFDNGLPQLAPGNDMSFFIQAEDFSLTSATVLNGVRFWSSEASPSAYRGSLTWWIYANNGGTPGQVLATATTSAVTRTDTGRTTFIEGTAFSEVLNEFSLPDVSLASGSYWLGLHNGAPDDISGTDMLWSPAAANNTVAGREDVFPFGDSFTSTDNGAEHAFQVSGITAVPEPGTVALAVGGVLPLAGAAIRRKRHKR